MKWPESSSYMQTSFPFFGGTEHPELLLLQLWEFQNWKGASSTWKLCLFVYWQIKRLTDRHCWRPLFWKQQHVRSDPLWFRFDVRKCCSLESIWSEASFSKCSCTGLFTQLLTLLKFSNWRKMHWKQTRTSTQWHLAIFQWPQVKSGAMRCCSNRTLSKKFQNLGGKGSDSGRLCWEFSVGDELPVSSLIPRNTCKAKKVSIAKKKEEKACHWLLKPN